MGPELLAVRHAPVGVSGICYGQSDVPVAVPPDEAATRVAEALGRWVPTAIWSSPLSRCHDVASLLESQLSVPLRVTDELLEMSFGEWEWRPWEELMRLDGQRLQTWMDNWREERPPGGESAEDLLARVSGWWQALDRGSDQLLIAHSGVVRALRVITGSSWDDSMKEPVPHLAVERFSLMPPV